MKSIQTQTGTLSSEIKALNVAEQKRERAATFNQTISNLHTIFEHGLSSQHRSVQSASALGMKATIAVTSGKVGFEAISKIHTISSSMVQGNLSVTKGVASMLNPVTSFIAVGLGLVSACFSKKKSTIDPLTQQMIANCRAMSEHLLNMHGEMRYSFKTSFDNDRAIYDRIGQSEKNILENLYQRLKHLELTSRNEARNVSFVTSHKLDHMNSLITTQGKLLSDDHISIQLQKFKYLIDRVEARLKGKEQQDPEKIIELLASELTDWVKINGNLSSPMINYAKRIKSDSRGTRSATVNQLLCESHYENALGYLAYYIKYELHINIEDTILESIFNTSDWLYGTNALVNLLESELGVHVPKSYIHTDEVIKAALNQIKLLNILTKNPDIVTQLLHDYQNAIDEAVSIIRASLLEHSLQLTKQANEKHPNIKEMIFDLNDDSKKILNELNQRIPPNTEFKGGPYTYPVIKKKYRNILTNHVTDDPQLYPILCAEFQQQEIIETIAKDKPYVIGEAHQAFPHVFIGLQYLRLGTFSMSYTGKCSSASLSDSNSEWQHFIRFAYTGENPELVYRFDELKQSGVLTQKVIPDEKRTQLQQKAENIFNKAIHAERKKAIANLFTEIKYQLLFQQALDRVDATLTATQAYLLTIGYIETQAVIRSLWDSEQIKAHLMNFINENNAAALPWNTIVPDFESIRNRLVANLTRNDSKDFKNDYLSAVISMQHRLTELKMTALSKEIPNNSPIAVGSDKSRNDEKLFLWKTLANTQLQPATSTLDTKTQVNTTFTQDENRLRLKSIFKNYDENIEIWSDESLPNQFDNTKKINSPKKLRSFQEDLEAVKLIIIELNTKIDLMPIPEIITKLKQLNKKSLNLHICLLHFLTDKIYPYRDLFLFLTEDAKTLALLEKTNSAKPSKTHPIGLFSQSLNTTAPHSQAMSTKSDLENITKTI